MMLNDVKFYKFVLFECIYCFFFFQSLQQYLYIYVDLNWTEMFCPRKQWYWCIYAGCIQIIFIKLTVVFMYIRCYVDNFFVMQAADMVWHNMKWYDMTWYWYDMIRHDMIQYNLIWYDITWYDMILHDMIWYDLIWNDMIWNDMIYDIWYKMIRYMIWYNMILTW